LSKHPRFASSFRTAHECSFAGGTIALAYDEASRITGITETGLPAKGFGYDELDRLTLYTSGGTTLSYGYDPNGNRRSLGAGNTVTSYTIDPGSNRLLGSSGSGTRSLTFDADGNVIVDAQPLVNYGYTYDASGRLVTAKTGGFTTSYTNNGIGQRVTLWRIRTAGRCRGIHVRRGRAPARRIRGQQRQGDPRNGVARRSPSGRARTQYYVALDRP
jgi:YD repeat-containing protein